MNKTCPECGSDMEIIGTIGKPKRVSSAICHSCLLRFSGKTEEGRYFRLEVDSRGIAKELAKKHIDQLQEEKRCGVEKTCEYCGHETDDLIEFGDVIQGMVKLCSYCKHHYIRLDGPSIQMSHMLHELEKRLTEKIGAFSQRKIIKIDADLIAGRKGEELKKFVKELIVKETENGMF